MEKGTPGTSWKTTETYRPRPVTFHSIRTVDDWRMKVYSISYTTQPIRWDVFENGLKLALKQLPEPAVTPERPGVGFIIAHQGRGLFYLVLSWWDHENEYMNRVYTCPIDLEDDWIETTSGETACVWDLQVIWHEREAFVKHILSRPEGADLEAYLSDRLTITV